MKEKSMDVEFKEVIQEENTNSEIKVKSSKNELSNIVNKINVLQCKETNLINDEDLKFLQEHSKDFEKRFETRSMFRSKFEFERGVLAESEHPTKDSQYWQAIGEQAVHVQELISLSFNTRKLETDMSKIQAQIEEFEYLISLPHDHEFEVKKLQAKLDRKKIELEEKQFHMTLQKKTAKERMREIRNSDEVIQKLIPQLKYGTEDFEAHHPERYFLRYANRMKHLEILDPESKEHVVKNFINFSQAPENKELAQKYLSNQQMKQIQAPTMQGIPRIQNQINTPVSESQIDCKSKDEMMEKDPVTRKFFSRSTQKILVATPHRVKEDKNVTNFFKMQTPAGFDCSIEQPWGRLVPDARNFIIKKALEENIQYVFFVDDDLLIPFNALIQLLHHFPSKYSDNSVAIVGGFYYRKYFPLESVGMHENEKGQPSRIEGYNVGDIIHNTLVLPSGCTLIKTSIFKKMDYPYYRSYTTNGRAAITEDTYLCQKIRDINGGDIITDTGVQCIHIDKQSGVLYGHADFVKNNRIVNPQYYAL